MLLHTHKAQSEKEWMLAAQVEELAAKLPELAEQAAERIPAAAEQAAQACGPRSCCVAALVSGVGFGCDRVCTEHILEAAHYLAIEHYTAACSVSITCDVSEHSASTNVHGARAGY